MQEMDGWPLRQGSRGRSRSRERDAVDSVHRSPAGGRRTTMLSPDLGRIRCTEGNHLLGRRLGAGKSTDSTHASFGGNMSKLELKQDSSQKTRMPIKVLIEEEMSKDYEQRRASPNVIAKLMGLDGLPIPRSVHTKSKKDSQEIAYLRERDSAEDHPCRSGDYQQEFKDVYEVSETCNIHRYQNQSIKKGLPKLSRSKKDIDFIRQKFQDAKRLAADVKFHNSKDFSDTLDVLDSNKDILLKFLQEPNSLFRKHLQDLQSVPSNPQSRHITLLKPSKIRRLINCETQGASSKLIEIHNPKGKDVVDLFHKKKSDTCDYSVKDKSPSASHRLEKPKFEEKAEAAEHYPRPTCIVVLKPTIDKIKTADMFPRRAEKVPLSNRRQKEYGTSHKQKLLSEIRYQQKLPDNIVIPRQKSTRPQISKETSKSVRNDATNNSLSAMALECDESDKSECLQQKSGKSTFLDSSLNFNQYNDWSGGCISSSFRSTESSLSREARKHLSRRWRISSRSQNTGFPSECSSTLGEMLALSDRETPARVFRKDFQPRVDCPSGINSDDVCKDGKPRKLQRSRSLPPCSTFPSNCRQTNRTGSFVDRDLIMLKDVLNLSPITSPEVDSFYENTMPFQNDKESYRIPSVDFMMDDESHLPESDESCHWGRLCGAAGHEHSEPSTSGYHDAMALADDITIEPIGTIFSGKVDVTSEHNMDDELPSTDVSGETFRDVADHHNNKISKKFKLVEHPHAGTLCNPITSEPESPNKLKSNAGELDLPISCKDSERPSPVSVLELLEEGQEHSSPECFERVNADLQGLRLQLQLLKKESKDADVGVELSSDEGSIGDGAIFQTTGMLREISTDDDERDFSYLIDMLSNAGFHGHVIEMVSAACSLPECPVVLDIFEKLEKVHDVPSWLRSERRLLFDLINSILKEMIWAHMDRHPWVKSRRMPIDQSQMVLADEVWQLLVKHRKELIDDPSKLLLDTCWLDVRDIIDVIGGDIEKVLGDDLLDELVHEFLSGGDVAAFVGY